MSAPYSSPWGKFNVNGTVTCWLGRTEAWGNESVAVVVCMAAISGPHPPPEPPPADQLPDVSPRRTAVKSWPVWSLLRLV